MTRAHVGMAGRETLENSFYVFFDYSLEIEFMFIYQQSYNILRFLPAHVSYSPLFLRQHF